MIIGPTDIRPVTTVRGAGTTALPAALAGKVIEARLLMALGDGVFRFTAAENEFDLPLPRNLPPGTQVRISPQPGGFFEVTVLDADGAPVRAAPSNAQAPEPRLPAQTMTIRPDTPLPNLRTGQSIEARVIANAPAGTARLATPDGEIDLPLPRPLPPGTQVRITAQEGGAVTIATRPGASGASGAAGAPPANAGRGVASPPPVSHPSVFTVRPEGSPPSLPMGQVVEARIASSPAPSGMVRFTAAGGDFDLPLPKTFPPGTQARVVAQPDGNIVVTIRPGAMVPPGAVPGAAPAAGATPPLAAPPAFISIRPEPGLAVPANAQPVDARVVSQPNANGMVRFSAPTGDFDLPLPQGLPTGTTVRLVPQPNGGLTLVPLDNGPEAPARQQSQPAPMQPAEAVRNAARVAVARQDNIGKVFASIENLPFRLDAPMQVRGAAEKLLDQRLPVEFAAKPDQLAKAFAASGIFAERMLASLPQQANAPPDVKLALFILRAALGSWSSERMDAPVRAGTHPPPPMPGGAPSAQPPANTPPRALMQAMPPEEFVPRVLHETDTALARINLHQIASLPDERAAARGDLPDARWSCEIPVNVDGRTAMFGFAVERDGRHGAQERDKKKWRVRAAVDLGDTGAVEADVRLRGEAVSANLFAEQAETARLLEAALPLLRAGLTAAGFDVEALSVRVGKSVAQPGPPGHFVDRRT